MSKKLYLAGPDVFAANAREIGVRKVAICARHGLQGVYPLDVAAPDQGLPPAARALAIYDALERAMRECDAGLVDLTPFRGPSMDVGTAFEAGFLRALGRPVFAYGGDARPFAERTVAWLGGAVRTRADGTREGGDGFAIEDFGLPDNLMIDGAVRRSSGHYALAPLAPGDDRAAYAAFESCVRAAAAWFAAGR